VTPAGHNVPDTPIVGSPGPQPPESAVSPGTAAPALMLSQAPSPVDERAATSDPPVSGGAPAGSIRREATETLVFRKPAPPEARAILRVTAADGNERVVEVGGAPVSIGRSSDNAIVLPDSRVSRHHGRLQTRRGTLVYTDLASTNGSRVNGVRVDECALGMGDRIVVGDTVLLVEQLPA
jgi:pSer/pThr/pTyr-binding forkhead associated (FHA) protein